MQMEDCCIVEKKPEDRYRYFLDVVVRSGEIWLLNSENEGCLTYDADGYVNVLIWPEEKYCDSFSTKKDVPIPIKIGDFMRQCKELDDSIRFMVFSTQKNTYVATTAKLCLDLYKTISKVKHSGRDENKGEKSDSGKFD